MVHQGDSEYSRAPEIEDVINICRALNQANAKYILIGGFAVIFHGGLRSTKDIDLLVDSADENIAKIKKALSILSDQAVLQITDDDVRQYEVVRIADEVVIDLMAKACNVTHQDAVDFIDWMELEPGLKIPVANKEILIKMKNTVRPSDKMDVLLLQNLIEEENLLKKK